MVVAEKRVISPDEYLTAERQALDKSEFFNGERIPMAGEITNRTGANLRPHYGVAQ